MSFIADFARSGMETQSSLDETMRARVATTSIWAQKIVDDTTAPEISNRVFGERLITDRPMYGCDHPDLKGSDQGVRGSYMAAVAYAQEAKNHRDELLAKYGK